jgi:hypothetical protein
MKDGFLCGGFNLTSWFYHEVHFGASFQAPLNCELDLKQLWKYNY